MMPGLCCNPGWKRGGYMPSDSISRPNGEHASSRFSGRSEFQDLIRAAFARAAQEEWQEIVVSDGDFADWPLGERAVIESLQAWSRSGRKFTMLARSYDELIRRHARMVTWRRTWSHIVECWSCPRAEPTDFPSAIWTPSWALIRLDVDHGAGLHTQDPGRRTQLRESLLEWARRSTPGFASSTLGL